MKYTEGPWEVGDDGKTIVKKYSATKAKVLVEGANFFNENSNKSNIERIVACVNACQGITTEALEDGVVKYCIKKAEQNNCLLRPYHSSSDSGGFGPFTFDGFPVWEDKSDAEN